MGNEIDSESPPLDVTTANQAQKEEEDNGDDDAKTIRLDAPQPDVTNTENLNAKKSAVVDIIALKQEVQKVSLKNETMKEFRNMNPLYNEKKLELNEFLDHRPGPPMEQHKLPRFTSDSLGEKIKNQIKHMEQPQAKSEETIQITNDIDSESPPLDVTTANQAQKEQEEEEDADGEGGGGVVGGAGEGEADDTDEDKSPM